MSRPALIALFAFVAAGCATKADVQSLETSLVEEMSQVRDDQLRLLAQMQTAVDSLDAAEARRASTGQGETARRTRQLEDAISELLEIVSQNNQLLNDVLAQRSASRASPTSPMPGSTNIGEDPSAPGIQGADSATQFYAIALEEFRRGNLETARGALEEFLAQYPGHELAPDAQYHIARTYEDGGDVAMALTEYQRVTELFPNSNRAPTSLWRRGLIEAERGNTAIARRLFTQIESGYPNSPELPLARQELENLGG